MAIARHYDESKNPYGSFLPGVPLRDLTDEEYDALTDADKAAVDASPMYRKTKPAAARKDESKE